jgi:nitrous oxidase accessory protein NosD
MSFKKLALLLVVVAATGFGAATAHATSANRTFVSNAGSAGNTSQGCSAGSPCDTFANALSVTNTGGEIDCLNAGDFGTVTITKSVTINCEGVSNGGITAPGANAITINTTGPVNLIGLDINGVNTGEADGVLIQSAGAVNIRNCKIYGFLYGLFLNPSSSGGNLVVDNVLAAKNYVGVYEYLTSSGVVANMTVRNSNINNNSYGIAVQVSGGTHGGATVEQTTLSFNSTSGLWVDGSGAVAVLGGSTVVNNGTGVTNYGGGATIYSFKNNQIGGNGTDGTPLTAYPGGPLN